MTHQRREVRARRGVQDRARPELTRRRGRGLARARASRRGCRRWGSRRARRGREHLVGVSSRALPTRRVSIAGEGPWRRCGAYLVRLRRTDATCAVQALRPTRDRQVLVVGVVPAAVPYERPGI
jgi:hypothetical protein